MTDRAQITAAVEWVAWWQTGGGDDLDPDQSTQARRILGERAYWIIIRAADTWCQRQAALDASFDYEAGLDDVYRRAGLSRTRGGAA